MIIYDLKTMQKCDINENTVVALGTFDGCHIGHLSVFAACRSLAQSMGAKSAVYTFSAPPRSYFEKGEGMCLFSLEEKIRTIRSLGLDYICIEDFDTVQRLDGAEFLENVLMSRLHALGACCGFNFRFGKNAAFGTAQLKDFFENRGGCVRICDKIEHNGEAVSSSLLRKMIEGGSVEKIIPLSRPYSVYAEVTHGKELGRTIGIPTINQRIPYGKVVPARGVYVTECEIGEDVYPAVTNVGVRPTVESDGAENMETHIIGYSGNLYGSFVRVNFYRLLRPEKKFSSVSDLKTEIEKNVRSAIEYFGK